jgi:hypothetical protein
MGAIALSFRYMLGVVKRLPCGDDTDSVDLCQPQQPIHLAAAGLQLVAITMRPYT